MPGTNFAEKYISEAGLVIGVDGAACFLYKHNIVPDVLIGDFDTADPDCVAKLEKSGAKVIRLQPEKNESDTEAAVDRAISSGAKSITILGALGGRIDHAMSNIMMLVRAHLKGAQCRIVGSSCELYVSDNEFTLFGSPGQTVSILPLTGEITVNASGLKYPLFDLLLKWGSSRGLSNVMTEDRAHISISGGYALIIKTKL